MPTVTLDSVSIHTVEYPPPGLACPTGWSCADIGSPVPAGEQTLSNGTWSVSGGGSDIYGTSDSFHYVWQPLSGDGSISARAVSQTNTSGWAKAGLMMRATTDPGSPYFAVFVTPANGVVVQWRTAEGGTTNQVAVPGATPEYLQITRTGPGVTFSAATSTDGANWTNIPGATVLIFNIGSGPMLSGMAVTSHNNGQGSAVVFDTVNTAP
jgi:hypothetical protein